MADNGIIIIGDQTLGFSERETYVYWDISTDIQSERSILLLEPYYCISNGRHTTLNYVYSAYATRWTYLEYEPQPISERYIYLHYSTCTKSDRYIYYYPETRNRLVFVEGLFTNTPLLMKYPKYYNWNYIPQTINPEFIVWSFYDIEKNDVTIKLISNTGDTVSINSGITPQKFNIEKIADKQYKITAFIDYTFDPGVQVTCYISMYDVKGNNLKPGMW